ncbi:dihydrolipoyllysine-residue succinyltransferase component of 2-oxoglutarate dehydrogenase complex, mitochondrial isoform X2 [Anabrus simplex]
MIWNTCRRIGAVSGSSMCGKIARCHHSGFRLFHCTATTNEEAKIVTVPAFAESVSEGDVRWEKSVGDHVTEDEVVAEIETDKTSVPVTSPSAGIVEECFVEDGATVKTGDKLFKLKVTGTGAADVKHKPASAAAMAPSAPLTVPTISKPTTSKLDSAPKTQSMTTAPSFTTQIPMTSIPVAAIRHAQALEAASLKVPPSDPTKEITGTRSEVRVKMNRMRQRIAQRLKEAQNTNAMLTTFNEVDMGNIMEFRKAHKDAFLKKYNIKMGFMSAFVKASAYALQDQPVVNAVIADSDIIYRDYIDISVAVATSKGLVVPVLRNVESMNFADIELNIAALSEKARKGHLALEDMDGGTFTVSNGGVFGSLMGTPIINPPQSAILGMHGILERPIAVNGQVVVRPMMYIALTYDHRLVDGREAVLFLRKIKAAIEDPRIMFLGL